MTSGAGLHSSREVVRRVCRASTAECGRYPMASSDTRPQSSPRPRRARPLASACRSRLPPISGRPSPTDEVIFADMLDERVHRTVSVARWILDLEGKPAERLAFPSHFPRGEMPDRVAGHAGGIEVGLQVADRTAHRREAKSVSTALDRLVEPRHVALARTVAGGMAVQTTRMRQYLAQFREYRRRPGRRIADRRKLSTLARSRGGASETACATNMSADKITIETTSGSRKLNCMLGCLLGSGSRHDGEARRRDTAIAS